MTLSAAMALAVSDDAVDSDEVKAIRANFAAFERQLDTAYDYYARGKLEAAAVSAAWAADIAIGSHSGLFMSPRLERLLIDIGRRVKAGQPDKAYLRKKSFNKVLHVTTRLLPVGGHSLMLRRWIESDPGRIHSIAVTQQRSKIRDDVIAAATATGGKVYGHLNRRRGGLFAIVAQLRELALEHDVVVLHTYGSDLAPSIAFADTAKFPPVVLLNHADHLFWAGSAISQVVGGMRNAAMHLAERRRRIAKERSILVPILVGPAERALTRPAAKQALGLDPNQLLLVSVARPDKYRTFNGVTYADLHVPLLKKHPDALLYVIGVGEPSDWSKAIAETGGRIVPLPLQNPRPYMQAADIYLDSYPFCSATSMMEAAGYGTPCVTRYMLPEDARICGMDHPGLFGNLIEARGEQEYLESTSKLISDREFRERKGREMLEGIEGANVPRAWCKYMESAFARAAELDPVDNLNLFPEGEPDRPSFGDPDIRIDQRYGYTPPAFHLAKEHLSSFPFPQRIAHWREVMRGKGFSTSKEAVRCLLPEWIVRTLKDSP